MHSRTARSTPRATASHKQSQRSRAQPRRSAVNHTPKRNIKIITPVKRVPDAAVRIRVASDNSGAELKGVKHSINPFCHIAVEEAVRLKEKKIATEIIALSVGPKDAQEVLRTALAMGADKAIHVLTDARVDQALQPLHVAKILQAIADREKPDVVLVGKQSIDDDLGQTTQMTAGLLNWPQVTNAVQIQVADDKKSATVTREGDVGEQTYGIQFPAVISADLRLNEPRYATLPNIMKARKQPIETIELTTLLGQLDVFTETVKVNDPPARPAGKKVSSVEELITELKSKDLI